jgi:hypothetical protein
VMRLLALIVTLCLESLCFTRSTNHLPPLRNVFSPSALNVSISGCAVYGETITRGLMFSFISKFLRKRRRLIKDKAGKRGRPEQSMCSRGEACSSTWSTCWPTLFNTLDFPPPTTLRIRKSPSGALGLAVY